MSLFERISKFGKKNQTDKEEVRLLDRPQEASSPARRHLNKSQFDSETINTFFEDDSNTPPKSVLKYVSMALAIAIFILLVANSNIMELISSGKYDGDTDTKPQFQFNSGLPLLVINLIIGALISFVASLLAVNFINSRNFKKNYTIRRLAHDDLLKHIFNMLRQYRQVYRYDQNIRLTLRPSEYHPNVFMAELHVSHHSLLTSDRKLVFRKTRSSDAKNRNSKSMSNNGPEIGIFDQEYIVSIADETISEYIGEVNVEDLYKIKDVAVNNSHGNVTQRPAEKDKWVYDINNDVHQKDINKIDFTIEFPITLNGFYYITFLFPTQNVTATLDYREVKDRVKPSVVTLLSSTSLSESFDKNEDSQIVVRYDGWLIPKSSILFLWYDSKLKEMYKSTSIKNEVEKDV